MWKGWPTSYAYGFAVLPIYTRAWECFSQTLKMQFVYHDIIMVLFDVSLSVFWLSTGKVPVHHIVQRLTHNQ
jgi:hypothetical protein